MTTNTHKINEIYIKYGYHETIQHIRTNLHCGTLITTQQGLTEINTWNTYDDEKLMKQILDSTSILRSNHYIGYIEPGQYYFHDKKQDQYEITIYKPKQHKKELPTPEPPITKTVSLN